MTDAAPPPPTIYPQTPAASASTMRRDLISAYFASGAKIGSWVLLSAFVYRYIGRYEFAVFAFVRGTLGILNYLAFGLGPAVIRLLAESKAQPIVTSEPRPDAILEYSAARPVDVGQKVYASAVCLGLVTTCLALFAVLTYARFFTGFSSLKLSADAEKFVLCFGTGLLLRLASDIPGAVLQTHYRIATDNTFLALSEALWVLIVFVGFASATPSLNDVGNAYVFVSFVLAMTRFSTASRHLGWPRPRLVSETFLKRLVVFGSLVVLAQLADFLYSPTDYVLISALIRPAAPAVADYAPAVQIDSGLLVLVAAMASVLLPRTALAHVKGDPHLIARYYTRGTVASATILAAAALAILAIQNRLFVLWFGNPMPGTQAILPLVLIHTVIGGSSAVGRSILLGMGKVKPFTIAVLVAGVSNVILSYIFVRYFDLGLRGIIYGTIVAVVGRCAIWMPWYVLRSLRQSSSSANPLPA